MIAKDHVDGGDHDDKGKKYLEHARLQDQHNAKVGRKLDFFENG